MRHGLSFLLDSQKTPDNLVAYFKKVEDYVIEAESLGFHDLWLSENHFNTANGMCPTPHLLLASFFQKTTRLCLGPAVRVLPLHHPLLIAEEFAMLDILSERRFLAGVGSGFLKTQFEGFGVDKDEKLSRFNECKEIIELALSGKPMSYTGKHYQIPSLALNIKPSAVLPLWVSVSVLDGMLSLIEQNNPILMSPFISGFSREDLRLVTKTADLQSKNNYGSEKVGVVVHTYVGDNHAKAVKQADVYLSRLPMFPSEDLSKMANKRLRGKLVTKAKQQGFCLSGDTQAVLDQVLALRNLGVKNLIFNVSFGEMPREESLNSMRLLSERVFPYVESTVVGL